ncbi:hypothetical protein SeJ_A1298 [Salmonella enterica subsp. enterica serovar Javiana str. GA_MM04042433]|nr:hypothetical protein SeJ_A1298 [Salmonella enterica subsp. enterica serovar Javiana str. GA_MM04042433]
MLNAISMVWPTRANSFLQISNKSKKGDYKSPLFLRRCNIALA